MQESHTLSRRRLFGATAATAAAVTMAPALGPWARSAAGQRRRDSELLVPRQNIGIQLFTIRDMQAADLPGTLALLAEIGYAEVELFTLRGLTAEEFRAALAAVKLRALAAHVGIDRWRNELETVLDEAETLGMLYVGVPGVFPNPPATLETYSALAHEFNRYGAAAADRGLRFYYHNHAFEFVRDRGTRLYDVLLNETDPDLVFFELDMYWIVTGGADPLDYLSTHDQARWPLFHVKDRNAAGEFADLGEGNINFARIFRELENKHYHHYFVERDTQVDPPRTARVGYEYLRSLRGRRGDGDEDCQDEGV
jgi:sugar phosphate isomerase/epimerase